MDAFNKPNLDIALASSYNQRGVDGYVTAVTSSTDQRKVNCFYEPVQNQITGKMTLQLAKRVGVSEYGGSGMGDYTVNATDVPYLISIAPNGGTAPDFWVIAKNGNVVLANNSSDARQTIVSASGELPVFLDSTVISGTRNAVLQTLNGTTNRTWYSTAIATWTEITDADYTGLALVGKMEHLDGFALHMTTTNRIYNSDANTLANWNPARYIPKEIEQDTGRGLARLGNIILAFGRETVEAFVNGGNQTGSPLKRVPALAARIGLRLQDANDTVALQAAATGQRHYYAILGGGMYFVGREGVAGATGAYVFNGARFEKVSPPFIDKILLNKSVLHVTTILFNGQEAVAFILTAPSTSPQYALVFFPKWKEWFEWTSTAVQFVNNGFFFIGMGGVGDSTALHTMTYNEAYVDGGATAFTASTQFKLPRKSNGFDRMVWCGVIGDTGTGSMTVEKSDDDYTTFSTLGTIDMASAKKTLYRCGAYRGDRVIRLSHSANSKWRVEKFIGNIQ